MTEPKPLRADARRNRDALLAAARQAFDAGRVDLRFDDFAALAGVGTGTLYRHFPTREALIEAVYHDEVVQLSNRARDLLASLPADQALTAFLSGMVDHMRDHEGLARTLAMLMGSGSQAVADGTRAMHEAVGTLVTAGVRDGVFRADVGAGSILMAIHGIGASYDEPDWQRSADGVVAVIVDGLRASSRGASLHGPLLHGPLLHGRSPHDAPPHDASKSGL